MDEKDKKIQELRRKNDELKDKNEWLNKVAKRAVNELCNRCGNLKDDYIGACDGCVFYEIKWEL